MKTLFIAALMATTLPAQAATIYLCRGYNGASFWTNVNCHDRNALIDRIATVDDAPWDQQVQQAQAQQTGAAKATSTEPTFNRLQYCAQLANERKQIESRYSNWQWQPPETINPDQQRTRAINADLAANKCPTR